MRSQGQLSAFAAAKLAKQQPGLPTSEQTFEPEATPDADALATVVGTEPYDGRHSGATTPSAIPADEEATVSTPKRRLATQLSTFNPTKGNASKDNEELLQVTLPMNETVTLIGEYDIEVVTGTVTIYGTVLRPNSGRQRVYAPSTHALPQIQSRTADSLLRIHSAKSGIRKLEKLSPLFRNIWANDSGSGRTFTLLGTTDDDPLQRSLSSLEMDKETLEVLLSISVKVAKGKQSPRIMAIGGISSGKSTFIRLLSNYIHNCIVPARNFHLDLDPGQPEFGPPGQLSLVEVTAPALGAPFTHPASALSNSFRQVRSHTIAAMSFKDDPALYKACAIDLLRHANNECPLIVNSCGWVSGLGSNVLLELVSLLSITDVVLLEPVEEVLVESIRALSGNIAFHKIPRRGPRPSSRTPAESRAMQTIAYFHHRLTASIPQGAVCRWSGKPVSTVRPWIVNYAGPHPGIVAVLSYGQCPNPEFLVEVLDGSVVAIVVLDDNDDDPARDNASSYPNRLNMNARLSPHDLASNIAHTPESSLPYIPSNAQGISPTLDPRSSYCVGLALIRGIDTEQRTFHLITPLPEQQMAGLRKKKVVLVRGSFDAPGWALLEDLYAQGDGRNVAGEEGRERPWVGREMVGIEGAVWRLRHPPLPGTVTPNRQTA